MNIIAMHSTVNGWAIAINKTSKGYTREMFVVNRVSPDNSALPLGAYRAEKEARKVANQYWLRDMGR